MLAVSGGADSVALLLAVDELIKAARLESSVTVAHLDHGLRGATGEADAHWVCELASELGYECALGCVSVNEHAAASADNLEQAARRARYEFLAKTARDCAACCVLVAHTMDDQAETLLLRLMRGSGAEGLGGMKTVRVLEAAGEEALPVDKDSIRLREGLPLSNEAALLVRPLLSWARRDETESYCHERNVAYRNDAMNTDEKFARIRVRRQLLPLMLGFNPRIVEALSRTATLLGDDASALEIVADELLKTACVEAEGALESSSRETLSSEGSSHESLNEEISWLEILSDENLRRKGTIRLPPLRVDVLASAPAAVRRLALRRWLKAGRGDLRRLEMVHLLAVEGLLAGERGGRVILLPGGAKVLRKRGLLYFKLD